MKRGTAILTAGVSLVLLASSAVQAVAAPPGTVAAPPGTPASASVQREVGGADHVVRALEKRGFEVAEGDFTMWGIDQCPESFALMGTCYFNNPTAPYNLAVLPHWPEEHIDPATHDAFGVMEEGYGPVFRLDPTEAILIYGHLPPEASYFGLQSYLFTREGEYQTDNVTYETFVSLGREELFFHEIPGNPDRIGSFDSLSDAINNVVIERQSGSSWDQLRYFIITPDRFMDTQVRQVLKKLSVEQQDIFSEAIPSNMRFGLGAAADEFDTAIRYARPADGGEEGTASWEWRTDPDLRVLRIRDTRPNRPFQPYPAWEADSPEPRGGVDEWYLQDAQGELANAVSVAWDQPCADGDCVASGRAKPFLNIQGYPFNVVGPLCEDIGMDCMGDTLDTVYQMRPGLRFDDGVVYAAIGTLGTATGNATYVSLGVNNLHLRLGALNVDGEELVGSAAEYGGDHAEKLYVHYFTRDCTGLEDLTLGECTSVPDSEFVVPDGVDAALVERDYMAAGTQRGAESTLLLPSLTLTLTRPSD